MVSLSFFGFLIATSVVYWVIPLQLYRSALLSISGLLFIATLDKNAMFLTLALSVFTYGMGWKIESSKKKKIWLLTGILGLIAILVLFKYLGLLIQSWNSIAEFFGFLPGFRLEKILLPLGLSYIIFKYISYLTDVYWGVVRKGNFIHFLTYGSLFTTFVAGPIDRFERIQPQLLVKQVFVPAIVESAFVRIVLGIFKKAVIADWIGYLIQPILLHEDQYPLALRMLAWLGYSIQIYVDFSAYSDIAIGSSKLFGISIMENFNHPYLQPNISQFWRCWHISLSDWIRDYIFFPLSRKSRKISWNIFFVPVIAMGLCGLWHGASWNFLIWGVYHGVGISIYQLWNRYKKKRKQLLQISNTALFHWVGVGITFIFVTIGWFWFK